jgi:heme/copper-type cytochrome/quinol oxidase subunit 3
MDQKPTWRRQLNDSTESSEGKKVKSSFVPIVIALGTSLFFLGVSIFIPLAIAGLVIVAMGIGKAFYDNSQEKFTDLTEQLMEKWPLQYSSKEKLGIWVFLSSEILLFGGLLIAYGYVRADSAIWPDALQTHNLLLGTSNTIILLTSSLAMILALYFIRTGNTGATKAALAVTFGLGLVFLVIKLGFEWPSEIASGFTISSGLPGSTYYTLTGVHAVHLAVGLVAVGYLMFRTFRGQFTKQKHTGVEGVGLYWHFVDIVWMFLFTLLYLV